MPNKGDINLDVEIAALDPVERRYLQRMISKLEGGDSSGIKAFLEQDYDEAPVSIDRFIDDDKYLGRVLKDPKCNSLVYEYWRNALHMIANSNAVEVILTGPIGSGKSTIVDIYMAYILHNMLCLRDPFEYYGLVRAQPITLLFFSLSKDLSQVGLFKGFTEMILSSPWFRERGIVGGGARHQNLRFPHKNIDYSLGAPKIPGQGIVGRNIIAGGLDEISEVASSKELELGAHQDFIGTKALQIYEKVARRMESRFLQGGRQPGKLFLISSKQDEAAFIERYVEKVKGSPHVIIFDDPIWEIKPSKMFSGVTFGVAIGDKYRDSMIMGDDDDVDELEGQGYDVIYPPIEYKRSFELDVNGALRDIAGISSSTTRRSKLIPRPEYLKRCINPDLHHPFTGQTVYLSDEKGDDTGIEDYFKMNDAFTTAPYRSIHVDLGLNGDAAGICMCHANHIKDVERMMEDGTFLNMRDHVIRFDFMLRVRNAAGASIPFWKIRRFILYLRKRKVKIGCVTFDGWQSVDCRQLLEHAGFNAELLSIDRNDIPYVTFRNAIYEERVEWYDYKPMLDEASELEHLRRKKKVDHAIGGCFVGDTRIPLLDGTCPTIEELDGKEVDVYSSRPDGVTVPGKARGRFTKSVTKLVDVVLDNGAVVRCTPEHLWMLRDGIYKEAQHLRPGVDRLRPINRQWPVNGGYERITDMSGQKILTHHMVESYMNGPIPKGCLVHHENEDKTDNRPENLSRSSSTRHAFLHTTKRHATNSDYRKKVAEGLQRFNMSDEGRRKHAVAMRRTNARRTKADLRRAIEKRSFFRHDIDEMSLHKAADEHTTNANAAARIIGCSRNVVVRVLRDNGFESWDDFLKFRGENHKVRYVIPVTLKKSVAVYDLEVDTWSNFALSAGVFVHNSKDVSDAGAGALFNALKNSGNQPAPDKTVEALRAMQRQKSGGIDPTWWLKDI